MRWWWNGRHVRLRPAWSGRAVRVRLSPGARWSIGSVATAAPCYGVHRVTGAEVRVLHAPLDGRYRTGCKTVLKTVVG
jgi:hypothetical protein